jgi:RND family efflux transporter MFP subunit
VSKRAVFFLVLVIILVISLAGYFGFATSKPPEPTPTPQTVAVTQCDVAQTVTAPGNLVNVNEADVKMPATGKLSGVNVRVGDRVTVGQALADLDPVTTTQAQVNYLEAQKDLEMLQKQRTALDYPRATDAFIKDLRKQIKAANASIDSLDSAYKNAQDPQIKSQLLDQLANAKANLKTLQSNLDWYTSKPSDNDIANADSELALAQAKFDAAKAVLDSLQITAPFDGVVLAVNAESESTYQTETSLFTIGDPKALEVLANVTEEDYPLLSIGQDVEIYFDALPDVTAQGKVERIIPKRIEGDRPLYNIYISLNEVPDGLVDGMTADTNITIASRKGVLCLPRAALHASGNDKAVLQIWNGISTEQREVTIGLRGDTSVEILTGLKKGDQVILR